jgi:DNA processing protein
MTTTKGLFWYNLLWLFDFSYKDIFSLYKKAKSKGFNIEDILNLDFLNEKDYQKLKEENIQIVSYEHELYPQRLLKFMKYPPILFCKGNLNLLKSKSVAIIGSRNASNRGIEIAKKIAYEVSKRGINVVSGYAKGIDKTAHFESLLNNGTTTIVLSEGILKFSEDKIKEFLKKDRVLIVSQFNPQISWSAQNAFIRNELICALSDAVIVIESGAEKERRNGKLKFSGTYDSAKKCIKMGIPLFVIDPKIFENPPLGNISLIREKNVTAIKPDDIDIILRRIYAKNII